MRLVIAGLGMVVSVEWEDIDKGESVKRQINRMEAQVDKGQSKAKVFNTEL